MRAKLVRVFEWRVWHLYLMAGVASVVVLCVIVAALFGTLYLRGLSHRETARNRLAIGNLQRIQRLERPPTNGQLAAAASRALRVCVADAQCRRALRGSIRGVNLKPSDVPSLHETPSTSPGAAPNAGAAPSTGGAGSTSGSGGGTGTTPRPRRPSSPTVPSRPTPAPRSPAAPAPAPARPSPAPVAPLPSPSTPAVPTSPPVPPATVPPVTVPPVPPPVTVPPVVPPVLQVCTPILRVNCRRNDGRIVGPYGDAADPGSNSGRGNQGDPLCERIKAVCPPGIIRPFG